MRKLIACVFACAFFMVASPAQATYHHVIAKAAVPNIPNTVSSSRFICWANPAGALICIVAVGIAYRTYLEIRKGCTNDPDKWPPRLWMPLCKWPANVVSVRG